MDENSGMTDNDTSSLSIHTDPTCKSLNDYLWQTAQDPTTLPAVWAIFAFFYTLIIIVGVTGNLCVILAIARTKSLQTVPNMFIFSLSCSDVMVCLTSGTITPITALRKNWIFGQFLCSVAPFLAGSFLSFSTFTLAAISVDRFLLIRFPMKKPFTHAQAFMLICSIIIIAIGLSIPVSFVHTLKKIHPYCGEFCFEDWNEYINQRRAYGTIVLTVQFIIPLSIIIVCYTAISVRLGKSLLLKGKKRGYNWEVTMTDQQRAANKRRQRTNRMFIAMVIAFSLSWCWSVLFNVFNDYKILPRFIREQSYLWGITTHLISLLSTIWNPILYSLLNLQLRAAFVQLMPECAKKYLIKEDEEALSRRGKARNPPSTLLLTADSRAFERSGASTPIPPPSRNGWLTPMMTGPRNSFAFPTPDANAADYQLVSTNQQKYGSFAKTNRVTKDCVEADESQLCKKPVLVEEPIGLKSLDVLLETNQRSTSAHNASTQRAFSQKSSSFNSDAEPKFQSKAPVGQYNNITGFQWRSNTQEQIINRKQRANSAVDSSGGAFEPVKRRMSQYT